MTTSATPSSSIHTALQALDMSQAELARRASLTPSALCHILRGRRRPSGQLALRLWHALERRVPLEVILGEPPEPQQSGEGG